MKKFNVSVSQTVNRIYEIDVEAETKEEAREKAWDLIDSDSPEAEPYDKVYDSSICVQERQ